LKPSSERNRQTHPGISGHNLFPILLFAPHLAASAKKKPNLLDRPMRNRDRGLSGSQFKMRDTPTLKLK
jgi:hypothetical protein